jgi:hypothetical protein
MLAACYWSFFHFGAILAAFMTCMSGAVQCSRPVAGLYIPGNWAWRMPSILQVIGPAMVFAVALIVPESPRVRGCVVPANRSGS